MSSATHEEILEFWFGDSELDFEALEQRITLWFEAGPEVDAEIGSRFGTILHVAKSGGLDGWKTTARKRLALVILQDQFTRNLHRGSKEAFALDAEALRNCIEGIELGMDAELSVVERAFFYMPLQHAEDLSVQEKSVQLFEELAAKCSEAIRPHMHRFLISARSHRTIIARFGRFPHRNRVMERECTNAENGFLTIGMVPFRSKN
jgi:uncharacterized protein (DUF924 family)